MPDLQTPLYAESQYDNLISILTRNALNSATNSLSEPQAQLWEGIDTNCFRHPYIAIVNPFMLDVIDHSPSCLPAGGAFNNISALRDPLFSELPSGTNSGIYRQFAPRINSSAKYELAGNFPSGCDKLPGAFYSEYANNTAPASNKFKLAWNSVSACLRIFLLLLGKPLETVRTSQKKYTSVSRTKALHCTVSSVTRKTSSSK